MNLFGSAVLVVALGLAVPATTLETDQVKQRARAAVTGCSPAPSSLTKAVADTWARTHNARATVVAIDELVRGDNDWGQLLLDSPEGLYISVVPPSWEYRLAVREALRKRESPLAVHVATRVRIDVTPHQIDAPNIQKLIVERDDHVVAPLASTLGPSQMATRLGEKRTINKGSVFYACSAFLPGAKVTVIAIPSSGTNIERRFSQRELEEMTLGMTPHGSPSQDSADTLIGLTEREVEEKLGSPQTISADVMTYETVSDEKLYLYKSEKIVIGLKPRGLPLADVKGKR